ncbi:hypothetical protein T439DRAFT_377078 [Meredithblackwellia eburnea MCA 4105]
MTSTNAKDLDDFSDIESVSGASVSTDFVEVTELLSQSIAAITSESANFYDEDDATSDTSDAWSIVEGTETRNLAQDASIKTAPAPPSPPPQPPQDATHEAPSPVSSVSININPNQEPQSTPQIQQDKGKGAALPSISTSPDDKLAAKAEPIVSHHFEQDDSAIARALQLEEDEEYARALQQDEADYSDEDEEEDGATICGAGSVHTTQRLTDDELLRRLPLGPERLARINREGHDNGAQLTEAALAEISNSSSKAADDHRYMRHPYRWTASQHPHAFSRSSAEGDEHQPHYQGRPGVADIKGPPRMAAGTPGTFVCPLCKEVAQLDGDTVLVPCPSRHHYCRGCLHGYVRAQLAERKVPVYCHACRRTTSHLGTSVLRDSRSYEIPHFLAGDLRLDTRDAEKWQSLAEAYDDLHRSRTQSHQALQMPPKWKSMPTRRPRPLDFADPIDCSAEA